MTTAISDMQTAYTDAAGRTLPTATELGAGNIGGMTITPGLYKWSTGVTIPTDVTLSGGVNDIWIFQIAQNLDVSSAKKVILSGGAQASNICVRLQALKRAQDAVAAAVPAFAPYATIEENEISSCKV